MKKIKIILIALWVSATATAQVTKPVIVFEDTSSSYIVPGMFTEVDGQIEMITIVRGFGLGYVVMDTSFKVLQEYIKPNYEWALMLDAHKLPDDGYWISGYKYSILPSGARSYNVTSLKLDVLGNLVWQSTLGDTSVMNFGGRSVIDKEGNIVVSGSNLSFKDGLTSISLTRFDSVGDVVAHDLYNRENLGTVESGDLRGMDVELLSNGNLAVLASINTASNLLLLFLIDQRGDTISTRKFGGMKDRAVNLASISNSHFYVLSRDNDPTNSRNVASQVWKFKNTGELIWENSYAYNDDKGVDQTVVPHKLRPTSDGGCVIIGTAFKEINPQDFSSSIHIAKFSPEGDMQWEWVIEDSAEVIPEDILQLEDGSYIANAVFEKYSPQGAFLARYNYYVRLSPDGTHVPTTTSVQEEAISLTVQVIPNPFTNLLEASFTLDQPGTYTARLYDLQGRVVQETTQQAVAGAQTVSMSTANLATGQYVLRIQAGDAMWSGKVVKR